MCSIPHFYPRSPCGERLHCVTLSALAPEISIHALLAESDNRSPVIGSHYSNFYPRSPCGERPSGVESCSNCSSNFYPRSPCGERRFHYFDLSGVWYDFYPRSPCGERLLGNVVAGLLMLFLSTLSLRRATLVLVFTICLPRDFYPRSPCGERHKQTAYFFLSDDFYPRSPCGERQPRKGQSSGTGIYFYPRSPCGERRHQKKHKDGTQQFLSTLSLRRATFLDAGKSFNVCYFYPRSPCGERHFKRLGLLGWLNFYPRSPCGERLMGAILILKASLFLSTLSLRRATTYLSILF